MDMDMGPCGSISRSEFSFYIRAAFTSEMLALTTLTATAMLHGMPAAAPSARVATPQMMAAPKWAKPAAASLLAALVALTPMDANAARSGGRVGGRVSAPRARAPAPARAPSSAPRTTNVYVAPSPMGMGMGYGGMGYGYGYGGGPGLGTYLGISLAETFLRECVAKPRIATARTASRPASLAVTRVETDCSLVVGNCAQAAEAGLSAAAATHPAGARP